MGASAIEITRHVLSENPKRTIVDPKLVPAAVALLLYPKNGEYCVLLNKRSECVAHHKGEIAFPGGRKDPEDATLLDTALRETYEEMGIHPEDVEILGEVDDIPTSSYFLMSTYVGTIPYPYQFKPNNEVADVLEVPISAMMDPANTRDEAHIRNGKLISTPTYAYQGRLIYGATARVLRRFLELLDSAPDKEAPWKIETPPR